MLKIFFNKSSLFLLTLCLSLSYLLHKILIINNSHNFNYTLFLIPIIIMLLFNNGTKIKYYHGAEHKVVNDYEINGCVSIDTVIKQSCVNSGCGTNLYVGLLLITSLLHPFAHSWSFILGWSLNYELMRSDYKVVKWIVKPIYFVGNVLQKYVFTSEPSMEQLEVAVKAFRALEEEE